MSITTQKTRTDEEMTFWDHLDVLRGSLFHIVCVLAVACVGCFIAMPYIFDQVILGPTTSDFFLYKFFASLGHLPFTPDFSDEQFPYMIYEIWLFIKPALVSNEIRNVRTAFFGGTFMFYLGCAVGYSIVFPLTFRFLVQYTLGERIVNEINLGSYIDMFLMMIFVMGIVFELPMVAWLLSKFGIIHKELLESGRRYAVVILLITAARITPSGDPFTLMVVFLPLYLLYEVSIKVVSRKPTT